MIKNASYRADYVVDINLNGDSGKEKATREKAARLRNKSGSFRIFSLKNSMPRSTSRALSMIWLELSYFLNGLFRTYRPEVIFTRSTFAFGTWAYGKLFKIPVIREVHADFLDEIRILYHNRHLHLSMFRVIHSYMMFFIKRADGLIFNNTNLERHFIEQYGIREAKTITVPNGCDTKRFYPLNKIHSRTDLGLNLDKKYLLFIGSVSKWHGVEYLLKIHIEITKRRDDVHLLIVGGHRLSEAEELRKKYDSKNVTFTGEVNYDKALLYINAADVCLIPVNDIRKSPGSPIKLYDSIACGKPVITQANTAGYSDIAEQYGLGITCDFTNTLTAASQILDFIDQADFTHYEKHNRKIAIHELEWDMMIDRWITFAEKFLNHPGNPR